MHMILQRVGYTCDIDRFLKPVPNVIVIRTIVFIAYYG